MSVSLCDSQGRPWGSGGCSWPAELPQPRGAARTRPGLGPWVAQELADLCVSDPLKRADEMGREHPRGPCGPYTRGQPLGLLPEPSTCRSEYTPVPGVTWLLTVVRGSCVGPHSQQPPAEGQWGVGGGQCSVDGQADGTLGLELWPLRPWKRAPAGHRALGWSWRVGRVPSRARLCSARRSPLDRGLRVIPRP